MQRLAAVKKDVILIIETLKNTVGAEKRVQEAFIDTVTFA